MSDHAEIHSIRWTFDDGRLRAEAICGTNPAGACRWTCADESGYCESWPLPLDYDEDGTVWHRFHEADYGDGLFEPQRHQMRPCDCTVIEFMNEDDDLIEACPRGLEFIIGTTPITPIFDADHYEWKPKEDT